MSDSRLRTLERRWIETGAVEDEAAWLRERLRAGGLSEEQLALAAHCAHEGARLALGAKGSDTALPDPQDSVGVKQWLSAMPRPQDPLILVRVALEASRHGHSTATKHAKRAQSGPARPARVSLRRADTDASTRATSSRRARQTQGPRRALCTARADR